MKKQIQASPTTEQDKDIDPLDIGSGASLDRLPDEEPDEMDDCSSTGVVHAVRASDGTWPQFSGNRAVDHGLKKAIEIKIRCEET